MKISHRLLVTFIQIGIYTNWIIALLFALHFAATGEIRLTGFPINSILVIGTCVMDATIVLPSIQEHIVQQLNDGQIMQNHSNE
jgi:hypothetical protein